ncbi:MAG: SUMF1/EgtB/PvdO family nonheme iron enzyme [Planctomycetales bacterium]|nr:SUMF1/EgtB/PvdO family nonheme iron enzyme [Planctomycetales bacterium]
MRELLMRTFTRLFCLLLIGALAATAVRATAVRAEDALPLGIVKEKPSSGRFVETKQGFMVPYRDKVPGSEVVFEMVPVPGGVVRVGSPESEDGRSESEGPVFEVEVPPFWIGKYEVTWQEYKEFMGLHELFLNFKISGERYVKSSNFTDALNELDAITVPTKLYEPTFTFEKGEDPRLPAVTMTQYAARQYTKWLSLCNGRFYRLPTEAEWEHACHAGAKTPYSFGADAKELDTYAWHAGNSEESPHLVGTKKPNAWGVYDMHGNAAEWVLDMMLEDGYQKFGGKRVSRDEAIVWPVKQDPRVVKGGHWASTAAECRVAARLGSDTESWKGSDPNIPLSPWWFTDDPARGVGMRLVRALEEPDRKTREAHWKEVEEDFVFDIEARLQEGRGVIGIVDPKLPAEIVKHKGE